VIHYKNNKPLPQVKINLPPGLLEDASAEYKCSLSKRQIAEIQERIKDQNEKITEQLNKEKLDAELKFLKSQIHPHFLFNTLNNLYALTLRNSPKSSEVVLKLSNLLDYMLYECNVPLIPLRKEIKQIKNIIELERMRYSDRLMVSFTASGDVSNKMLPPLLMLPFIENAFKHGVSKEIEESFISIDLNVKDDHLVLRVENSKSDDLDSRQESDYAKGIGLWNVRRRLELIFGTNYNLQVFNEEEVFMIVLQVPIEGPNSPDYPDLRKRTEASGHPVENDTPSSTESTVELA